MLLLFPGVSLCSRQQLWAPRGGPPHSPLCSGAEGKHQCVLLLVGAVTLRNRHWEEDLGTSPRDSAARHVRSQSRRAILPGVRDWGKPDWTAEAPRSRIIALKSKAQRLVEGRLCIFFQN